MRKILRFAALAWLSACAFASAHAATPVAVWDNFDSLTSGGYTWTKSAGTTVSDGVVTIGADGGMEMAVPTTSTIYNSLQVTVIMDAEVPSFEAESPLIDIYANGSYVTLTTEAATMYQRWDFGGSWGSCNWTPGRRKIAVTYKGTKGTGTRSFVNGANVMSAGGLMSSSGKLQTLKLGCYAKGTTTKVAPGLKIYKVAIFDTNISDADVANYKFPSDPVATSVNFGSNRQAVTAGTDPGGIVGDTNWYNVPDGSGTDVAIGEATVTFDSAGTYSGDATQQHLKGYLDENKGGSAYPINVTFKNLAADRYDVYIYCESDNASGWSYKVVNGESYYADASGRAVFGTSTWGSNGQTSVLGQNVMVVPSVARDADGNIAIRSERNGSYRGCVAAVQLVEHNNHVAEIDGDAQFSTLTWDPAKPAWGFTSVDDLEVVNTESATLTFDTPVTAGVLKIVNEAGKALTFDKGAGIEPSFGVYDFSEAAGGVVFDASGLDGEALAKNTAAGAPYSHWLLRGVVQGGENVTVTMPTMPSGYDAAKVVDKYGVRLVVTAPKTALFGSVDINFMGNQNKSPFAEDSRVSGLTSDVGAHPVVGTSWTDLASMNHTTNVTKYVNSEGALVTGATIPVTVSQCANAYGSGAAVNTIFRGYIDDSGNPLVQIGNIPFAKYRVIVYRATDTGSTTFSAVQVGKTAEDAKICYGPEKSGASTGYTVIGATETDWGNSNKKDNPIEGVNYVVSDVLEGTPGSGTAYVYSHKHAGRACVAAIQIVEVGKLVEGYKEYKATISSAGTFNLSELSWTPSPFAPTASDYVKVTIDPAVAGEVVVNFDRSDLAVNQFLLVSKGDVSATLTGNAPAAISAWDFSETKGRVAFGFETDFSKVIRGEYPCIGIAYPYTGTIESGFEYMGAGNALTLTTISSGQVVISGSGALYGNLDVTTDGTSVTLGGAYSSPNDDVNISCTHGWLTIAEGADITVPHVSGNRSGTYGGGSANITINGKLTATKSLTIQSGWSSPRGIHFTVNNTGSLIAETSTMLMANPGYNYCSLTVNGGIVKVRGINVGSSSGHGAAYNPSLTVRNGGILQIAEGVVNPNNGTFSISGGTLSAYSYSGSTGYTWSPTNTTVSGTVTFDMNGLGIVVAGVFSGTGANVVAASSSAGGVLTMNTANAYSGGTEIGPGATVRLGNDSALGTGDISVAAGATLDFAGYSPSNAIAISGAGAGNAGALVNTGTEAVSPSGALNLVGNATIGGPAGISYGQDSSIDLGGHTLTVDGTTLSLGSLTVRGGGAISVKSGALASAGETTLEDIDLAIGTGGALDLSGGTYVSCRDFASAGTVSGTGATLIVRGTFDATSPVRIPKLKLVDAATLNGVGLTITDSLTMEESLYIVVDELKPSIQIATVPEKGVVTCKYPYVNGRTTYAMVHKGTKLWVVEGERVLADIQFDSVLGWTNFKELKVEGKVTDFHGSAFGKTNVNVVVTSGEGVVTTQRFEYATGADGRFRYVLDGVDVGQGYDVSAFLTIEGADVDACSSNVNVVTARPVEGWIDEDVDTFTKSKVGTGLWSGTENVASADGSAIAFTNDWEWIAEFQPTNDSKVIRSSLIKDVHYKTTFTCPGLYACEDPPAVPVDWFAAVTTVADEDDTCRFAVVSNGMWVCLSERAVLDREYEIVIRVDCQTSNVVYNIANGSGMFRMATCPFVREDDVWTLPMAGTGYLASRTVRDDFAIKGFCHDINLFGVADDEYENLDDALAAAGETMDITPLWVSRFGISGKSGKFRIVSNGLLELLWKKWHHYFVDRDGDVDVYRYLSGNNWIEYADVAGIATNETGAIVVYKPEGLAWIAESATNDWFYGTVVLGNDIDLTEMNWTPVAQFSGTFDGNGRTITGLNNTNVVAELGDVGVYLAGPTNDFGRMAYGLFATATNAVFRNVAFEDVAIDNGASAVAALLGMHAGGDLAVSNVTVASGAVVGNNGGAVAGIVGTAEDWGDLVVVNNTNAAQYVGAADGSGALTHWAAGILTVGGTNETVGTLVVMGNVNRGTVANVVRNDADGGNVAQIVAGTTWGTKFGAVVVTNNVASGEVVAEILNHDGWRLGPYDEWLTEVFPVCNLAPAVTYFTEADGYRRFVEANSPASVPVDPVYRTARMLAGKFQNGADNVAGWWMDTISTMTNGANLWIKGEMLTNDAWQTVTVDRSIGFDLRGNTVYTIEDTNTFCVTHDAQLSISNGTIIVPEGVAAFRCVGASSVVSNDINIVTVPGDFYERTVMVDDMFATMDMFLGMLNYLPSGTTVQLDEDSGLTVDQDASALLYDGKRIATLSGCRSLVPDATYGDGVAYVFELNDKALPEFDLDATSVVAPDGAVTISLSGTRAGFYYAVQKKASLVEKDWSDASEWQYVGTDGTPVSFTLPAEETSGFYRVKVTDRDPSAE